MVIFIQDKTTYSQKSQKKFMNIENREIFENSEIILKELPTDENSNKCFMFGIG